MQIGDFYFDRDEFQSAADRYRSVIDRYPGLGQDAEALFKLGVCYRQMKRNDEALRLFHVVVENYRDSPVAERALERLSSAN